MRDLRALYRRTAAYNFDPARISDAEGVRSRISRDDQIEAPQVVSEDKKLTDTLNLNFVFSSASAQCFEKRSHSNPFDGN